MLSLPNEDITNKTSRSTFEFESDSQLPSVISFTIIERNPLDTYEYSVRVTSYHRMNNTSPESKTPLKLFDAINKNIKLLELGDLTKFVYDKSQIEDGIQVANFVEFHFRKELGSSLLTKLNLTNDTIVTDLGKF
ncbi:uncharacterized protein TNCV_2144681 [Trichonephila clavipes]|nr:uncharacterized protein TNCV_2144681 [Trichonephila clavipes]